VFRKLEQNVWGFKKREEELAHDLGLKEEEEERAGALIVGRFEDGTPVTLSATEETEEMVKPVPTTLTTAVIVTPLGVRSMLIFAR